MLFVSCKNRRAHEANDETRIRAYIAGNEEHIQVAVAGGAVGLRTSFVFWFVFFEVFKGFECF